MNVTYSFRNANFEPYAHSYDDKVAHFSFVKRSRIFVYEYISENTKEYIDWQQLDFYDQNGVKLDDSFDSSKMSSDHMNHVIVDIKHPIHTMSYPFNQIKKKLELPSGDFECFYYWASACFNSRPFGLHGISRKHGNIITTYLVVENDKEMEKLNMTPDCKKRVEFIIQNIQK
jgi:hypothetical protein